MANGSRDTLPVRRLLLLALVILVGLALFVVLGRDTPVVVEPAGGVRP